MSGQTLGIPNPATSDELEEGRPWWKICCAGCCLGILVAAALVIGGLRWAGGPGPTRVKSLPDGFPSALVLFRPEEAREIIYYPASSKGRIMRFVTGPLDWIFGRLRSSSSTAPSFIPAVTRLSDGRVGVETLERAIKQQMSRLSGADTVAMRWNDLAATPDEVIRFYSGALVQAGAGSPQLRRDPNAGLTELAGASPSLNFSLLIVDDATSPTLDSLTVIVEYPSPKKD